MAPVKIAHPNADQARSEPRAFALLTQVPGYETGTVDSEDLARFASKYGNNGSFDVGKEIGFSDVVTAFKKPSNRPEGGAVAGIACKDKSGTLEPWSFDRRPLADDDIKIQIAYCGICHSDLHQMHSEWGPVNYPLVPGHEITGIVVDFGPGVKKFKIGDRAGVGWFMDSCRECPQCEKSDTNYCDQAVCTFAAKNWRHGNEPTYGGFASQIVVAAGYAVRIPDSLSLAGAAPLMCAGITTYSPLLFFGLDKPGTKLGVVGLGGLGHIAVKLGKGLGLHVTVISTSESKRAAALELGADDFLVSKDEKAMAEHAKTLDGILDNVAADHPVGPELNLLKPDGRLIMLGIPSKPLEVGVFSLIGRRLSISGSAGGSIKELQAMVDLCGEKGITCDVEEVPCTASALNTAMERLAKGDVRGRFVVDVQGGLID